MFVDTLSSSLSQLQVIVQWEVRKKEKNWGMFFFVFMLVVTFIAYILLPFCNDLIKRS